MLKNRQLNALFRLTMVALAIIMQLAVLALLVFRLREQLLVLFILLEVLSLVEVLLLIDDQVAGPYKIAWTILILLLPVFGWMLYLLWGKAGTNGRKSRRLREMIRQTRHYTGNPHSKETIEQFEQDKPDRSRIMHYLCSEGFALYQNTGCRYYSLGDDLFPDLLDDLRAAQRFIFIEFFIVSHGHLWQDIWSILCEKARQGIEIHFMYDDMGSLLKLPSELDQLQNTPENIQIRAFNPVHQHIARFYLNFRNHRKTVIIDGDIAYTGGINLADEYANLIQRFGHWKDSGIRMTGEAVWGLTLSFLQIWTAESPDNPGDWDRYRPQHPAAGQGFYQPFFDGPMNNPRNPAEEMYSQIIQQATRYVYIMTPYLILDDVMISSLCTAARSGIDVRIITPAVGDRHFVHLVTRSNYGPLLRDGVRIFEYSPGFIHAKTILSDDDHAVTGTINMDFRSFHLHFESGVWICDAPVLQAMRRDFDQTLAECREISMAQWNGRSLGLRILQTFLRLFSPLL